MFLLSIGLVLGGAVLLVLALVPIRRLIAELPAGRLRHSWYVLADRLLHRRLFTYIVTHSHDRAVLPHFVVPGTFFLGACFVVLVNLLSLKTARDVRRMAILEHESVTDPLTGICDRRYLERQLKDEVARAPGVTACRCRCCWSISLTSSASTISMGIPSATWF